MDTDRQTGDVHDEYEPTVTVWLVGYIFPFQDEPEHDGRQGRGVGIDLTLHSREPERVAEGVYQSTHQTGCLDGDELWQSQFTPVGDEQTAC